MSASITLRDGVVMPAVGLGTFQGSYDYGSLLEAVVAAVASAVDRGYRHFDTAWLYNTEEGLGLAVRDKIRAGAVTREELFITSKLWCTGHRREEVVPALRRSLEKLKMDYVDNWLVHWPPAMPPGEDWPKDEHGNVVFEDERTSLQETWEGMEECVRLGLARTIGVSNFNQEQLERLLPACRIPPSNIQIESHPFFTNRPLVEWCLGRQIVPVCFSPLGKPHRPWYQEGEPVVFTHPTLVALGKKHAKTPAQVALRFQVQRGLAVVPKSSTPANQALNLQLFDFDLSEEDVNQIFTECDKYERVLWLDQLLGGSKEYPYKRPSADSKPQL